MGDGNVLKKVSSTDIDRVRTEKTPSPKNQDKQGDSKAKVAEEKNWLFKTLPENTAEWKCINRLIESPPFKKLDDTAQTRFIRQIGGRDGAALETRNAVCEFDASASAVQRQWIVEDVSQGHLNGHPQFFLPDVLEPLAGAPPLKRLSPEPLDDGGYAERFSFDVDGRSLVITMKPGDGLPIDPKDIAQAVATMRPELRRYVRNIVVDAWNGKNAAYSDEFGNITLVRHPQHTQPPLNKLPKDKISVHELLQTLRHEAAHVMAAQRWGTIPAGWEHARQRDGILVSGYGNVLIKEKSLPGDPKMRRPGYWEDFPESIALFEQSRWKAEALDDVQHRYAHRFRLAQDFLAKSPPAYWDVREGDRIVRMGDEVNWLTELLRVVAPPSWKPTPNGVFGEQEVKLINALLRGRIESPIDFVDQEVLGVIEQQLTDSAVRARTEQVRRAMKNSDLDSYAEFKNFLSMTSFGQSMDMLGTGNIESEMQKFERSLNAQQRKALKEKLIPGEDDLAGDF